MNSIETKPAKKAENGSFIYYLEQSIAYFGFLVLPWLIFAYLILKHIL